MSPVSPLPITLADEAGEGLALLGMFGLIGLAIFVMYLAMVVLAPLGIVALVRPERGIDRALMQSLAGCAAFPPIGLGVAALTHTLFDTRGPSPSRTEMCTGAALIALPTLALMLAAPARRTATLIVGLGVWIALAAIAGIRDSTPGTPASHLSDAVAWSLILWVVFAAFVLPGPLMLSLTRVGGRGSAAGLAASLAACTACLPVAVVANGLYLELTGESAPAVTRTGVPIAVLVIALAGAFACVIWPRGRWLASIAALALSAGAAVAMTLCLSP